VNLQCLEDISLDLPVLFFFSAQLIGFIELQHTFQVTMMKWRSNKYQVQPASENKEFN
jgi:hypothetical protein